MKVRLIRVILIGAAILVGLGAALIVGVQESHAQIFIPPPCIFVEEGGVVTSVTCPWPSPPWTSDGLNITGPPLGCTETWICTTSCSIHISISVNGGIHITVSVTDETGVQYTLQCPVLASKSEPATAIWLADVCEPNDGFSSDGAMTWDSNNQGPLEFAASMEGPWYAVEVNGPPWVVTEENMESFAAMVGLADWHDMWVRSGVCYPRHVGNTVAERDARMDDLCE